MIFEGYDRFKCAFNTSTSSPINKNIKDYSVVRCSGLSQARKVVAGEVFIKNVIFLKYNLIYFSSMFIEIYVC
jgi:hypothetical protein